MNDRLQFRHHSPIFDTRERAIDYIFKDIKNARSGITRDDETLKYSLFSEPAVLRYKNDEDDYKIIETTSLGEVIYDPNEVAPNPHVILAIGSNTNNTQSFNENRYCIIDIDKTEQEIADLWEYIENSLKGLSIITKDSDTLKLYAEKTSDGTVVSGDVVVAESQIFDDRRRPNTLLSTKDGLFTFVKLEFTPGDDKFTFIVNGETTEVPLYDYYIVRGYYDRKDESLHLIRKDGIDVKVSLENLVGEWSVEGEASKTPIVLTREEIGYGDDALHNHVEPWQDVLKADVRIDSGRTYNILSKTNDGRYLYVDGVASNITYFKDGEAITVQDALKSAMKNASNDSTNIIYEKVDGFYATAQLKYKNKENKLIFTTSNSTGGTTVEEINLNAVEAFDDIYYNPSTETLVIKYTDGSGDIKTVEIPIGEMMTQWEWDIQNEGHNIKLHKQRVIAGNDKVSADAAIYDDPNNILVDKNHELFVKGTADNIRYGRDGNVSDELDKLNANDSDINARLNETSGKVDTLIAEFDAEVERATTEEQRIEAKLDSEISRSKEKDTEHDGKISTIEQTIGDGFTTDGHETVTYKFNELSAKTNSISAKTDTINANLGLLSAKTEAEIVRAKGEEQRIEKKFDDSLGDGFSIRNTVRDEFNKEKSERIGEDARLQAEIDALSASTSGKLVDVINIDHSINVDKTDPVKPVIKVNLSDETIDGMQNVIKLNNDGLYAGVDLDYYFESGTSKNVLVFKTTNGTKTFDLKTNSVVDKIYYDPTKEAIIIEYTVDGKRMPDVVVPVHDLINEWRVSEDTNGAIKLHKYRESGATQDILYAESVISDHEDNILVNDNGALYVSGAQIEKNKADIEALGERVDKVEIDVDALKDDLAAEVARATGEEQRIEEKVDREIERASGEDNDLWDALRAEINRSTNKDLEHDTKIAEEVQRAKSAERDLHDEIVTETARATRAESELNAKIESETNRATGEEQRIEQKIEREITRSTNEDNNLWDALRAEINRSTSKDTEHDTKINELRTDLTNESNTRFNEDTRLENLITQEENRAKTVESAITQQLNAEIAARQNGDIVLDQKIESETYRATGEEQRIERKLDQEITRSIAKDDELQRQINDEVVRATSVESDIKESLVQEIADRTIGDANLQAQITSEVERAQGVENTLNVKIENEREARANEDAKIWAKMRPIEFFDTTTVHNERVRNSGETPDEVRHRVILSNASENILKAKDDLGGLYAAVSIGYNEPANALTIYDGVGQDRKIINTVTLGPGSLIKDISYDHTEKDLVITYRRAGESEDTVLKFPVADLFNEWDIQNPSEGSALELHKENQTTETGTVDILWGRVLLTGAVERPDGTIDYGDNIIRIVNNGLYASGTPIIEAQKTADCVKNELSVVEEAVLGHHLDEFYSCGSGYTYSPFEEACFIKNARNMMEADEILDRTLCNVKSSLDCLWEEVNITQQNVIGLIVPDCGKNADGTAYVYPPHKDACFISAATSMVDADFILDQAICNLGGNIDCAQIEVKRVEDVLGVSGNCAEPINYPVTQGCLLSNVKTFAEADAVLEDAICNMKIDIVGSETPTATLSAITEDEKNYSLQAHVRLSHGNEVGKWQSDEEITISDYSGDEVEPGVYEFTDTNVLRKVDIPSEVPESKYNGLYLSNVWNCGQYTENGQGTPYEKYKTDESENAQNYYQRRYRNSVRHNA